MLNTLVGAIAKIQKFIPSAADQRLFKALKFLKGEAATASLLEIKRSISNLIEDQLEIQMMAKKIFGPI